MREIKFRIRLKDKHDNAEMVIFANLFGDQNSLIDTPIDLNQFDILSCDQFTGLKDKHGKEIYEGDICTANYAASFDKQYKNAIVWNELEHGYALANSPLWTWENIEVVGNIHQNPELLK